MPPGITSHGKSPESLRAKDGALTVDVFTAIPLAAVSAIIQATPERRCKN